MIRNLTTSAISYGTTFPFGPPQADGILFFKTAADPNGQNPIGLYVYSFQNDSNTNFVGDQVGSGWKTAVDVSAFITRTGDQMSGNLAIGGFDSKGGVRCTISSTTNPGTIDFIDASGAVVGAAGWSASVSKLQFSGAWDFENLPTVSGGALIWTSFNDGTGSGLDADVLDGEHGSFYLNLANSTGSIDLTAKTTGTLPITRGGTGAITAGAAPFALKGANTDIISLNSPALANATANTQIPGTTSNIVATCAFVQAAVASGSMTSVLVSGTTQAASSNKHYILVNSGTTTVTLPLNPVDGDRVRVSPMNGLLTNIINRNGKTIMGGTNDLILNNLNVTVELMYNNSTWYVVDGVMVAGGGGGGSGSYNASQIIFTPVGNIAAINVQSGMAELDSEKVSLSQLAASAGSSLVGYIGGGTTVIRTVQSKLRDMVSVFDYMTQAQINDVKAGTTLIDVTAPILAGIADIQATGGGVLYFPPGKYKITQNLTITWPTSLERFEPAGKVVLRGAGSSLTAFMDYRTSVSTGACVNYDFSGYSGSDLLILSSWTGGFSIIKAVNATTVTVAGVYTLGTGTGFKAASVWGGEYSDISVVGYLTNLSFIDCTNYTIKQLYSTKCDIGLYMSRNAALTGSAPICGIYDITFSECKTWAVKAISGSFKIHNGGILNCGFIGTTSGGILYQASSADIPPKGLDVSNVTLQNNSGTSDILIDVPGGTSLNNSTNIEACTFIRTDATKFTTHNVTVNAIGLTILNLNVHGCGFTSAGFYVPDVGRKYIHLTGSTSNINPIYIGNRYGVSLEEPDSDNTKYLCNDGTWSVPASGGGGAAVGNLDQVLANGGNAPTRTAKIAQLQITDPTLFIQKHPGGLWMDICNVFTVVPGVGGGIAPNANNFSLLGGDTLRWSKTYTNEIVIGSALAKINTGIPTFGPDQSTNPDRVNWLNVNNAILCIASLGITPTNINSYCGSTDYPWGFVNTKKANIFETLTWNNIVIPAPTVGSTTNFLRQDGTWAAGAGGSGGSQNLDQVLTIGNTTAQTATFGRVQFNNSNVYIEKNVNGNFLDLAGTLIVSPGQGISPPTSISLDIGSAMYRWKAIYTNTINVAAGLTWGNIAIPQPFVGGDTFLKRDGTWAYPPTGGGATPPLSAVVAAGSSTPSTISVGAIDIGTNTGIGGITDGNTGFGPWMKLANVIALFPGAGMVPTSSGTMICGGNGYLWASIGAVSGVINTSDSRDKENIQPISLGLDFINDLTPVSYTWKNQNKHLTGEFQGLIAQEVKEVSEKHGVKDFAGWISDDKENPDSRQGLRYTELIAPLIKAVQELSKQNEELKRRIESLEKFV